MALKIDCFTTILPWWRHHLNIEQTTFPFILSKKSMRLASCLVESVLSTFAKLAHPFEGKEITQDPVLLVLRYFESFLFLPKCLTLPHHSCPPTEVDGYDFGQCRYFSNWYLLHFLSFVDVARWQLWVNDKGVYDWEMTIMTRGYQRNRKKGRG